MPPQYSGSDFLGFCLLGNSRDTLFLPPGYFWRPLYQRLPKIFLSLSRMVSNVAWVWTSDTFYYAVLGVLVWYYWKNARWRELTAKKNKIEHQK